ncbi:MAG: 4-(cytidine 5'-diphospho)-2-C-methyl-D-erythritol kinase [Bdellovibrionales bacterium]
MLQSFAPAKINLYLHVTGRREDGYHYLDSLVTFASVGDRVTLEEADQFSFVLDGPMAAALKKADQSKNLVVQAAYALSDMLGRPLDFKLTLTKHLPVASGIGGGSSDAAAALRLIAAHVGMAPDAPMLHKVAASLGQDVPCCLAATSCYFEGVGDQTSPAPSLPHMDIVLVNPRKSVSTPAIFKAREGGFSKPAERLSKSPATLEELVAHIAPMSNDLMAPAMALCPPIRAVMENLEAQEGCLLARMSGSGATCFGLFRDRGAARQAMAHIHKVHPEWWVVQGCGFSSEQDLVRL